MLSGVDACTRLGCRREVRDALALDTVNIGPWLKTLSVEDLEGLEKAAENAGKGGNTKSLTATYAKFVSEYKHLKDWLLLCNTDGVHWGVVGSGSY